MNSNFENYDIKSKKYFKKDSPIAPSFGSSSKYIHQKIYILIKINSLKKYINIETKKTFPLPAPLGPAGSGRSTPRSVPGTRRAGPWSTGTSPSGRRTPGDGKDIKHQTTGGKNCQYCGSRSTYAMPACQGGCHVNMFTLARHAGCGGSSPWQVSVRGAQCLVVYCAWRHVINNNMLLFEPESACKWLLIGL